MLKEMKIIRKLENPEEISGKWESQYINMY